jgi:hypothetical protein
MRKKLWHYRKPLFNALGMLYTAKEALRPHRKSFVERHWGKALMAGAGAGLGYWMFRHYRPDTVVQTQGD